MEILWVNVTFNILKWYLELYWSKPCILLVVHNFCCQMKSDNYSWTLYVPSPYWHIDSFQRYRTDKIMVTKEYCWIVVQYYHYMIIYCTYCTMPGIEKRHKWKCMWASFTKITKIKNFYWNIMRMQSGYCTRLQRYTTLLKHNISPIDIFHSHEMQF